MMRTPRPSSVQRTDWMMSTPESYRARSGRASFVLVVLVPRLPPPLGEMAVEKCDERPFLRRMRLATIAGGAARRRQRNRIALVDVARDHDWMDVRLAANRRRVAELRRDESHRHGDVPLRFALVARRAELGQHGRGAERSTPRPKVLRAEVRPEPLVHVVVDVARREVAPAPVGIAIAKESRAWRLELARHQLRQLAIDDDLPLLLVALSEIREHDAVSLDRDVLLAQRRYAVCPILPRVPLSANAAEALADEAQHRGRDGVAREVAMGSVLAEHGPHLRERLGKLTHAVVLAQLAPLDGTLVVAILFAIARVVAPRLDAVAWTRGNTNIAPRGRDTECIDALERTPVANESPGLVGVPESGSFRAQASQPPSRHMDGMGKKKTALD